MKTRILLNGSFATRDEVIAAIGARMVEAGDVTPRYAASMLEKERQYSTWVTEGVALPHGTSEARSEVLRDSVVMAQLPAGVDWGGKTVYVAIGLAGTGNEEHLNLLATLAGVLQDRKNIERLRTSPDEAEILAMLSGAEAIE